MRPHLALVLASCLVLSACAPAALAEAPAIRLLPTTTTLPPEATPASPLEPAAPTSTRAADLGGDSEPAGTATSTPLPGGLGLDPADWHDWPIIPIVPEDARLVYVLGQELGNDPHAFSVFGDCQSEPEVFMAVYETDPELAAGLPADLQETVGWFTGSFTRDAPTIRGGTTAGSLLWPAWHQGEYTCTPFETPLLCELRLHKPSFVIIHVGSHYEDRNEVYTRTVLEQLTSLGVVPILATKADNRETDEHVNLGYAGLAVELGIPLWNFWAAVDGLPNRGLYTRPDVPLQGDLYLTEQARVLHRLTALQALDVTWRAVTRP